MCGVHNAAARLLPPHHRCVPLLHGKQGLPLLRWEAVQSSQAAGTTLGATAPRVCCCCLQEEGRGMRTGLSHAQANTQKHMATSTAFCTSVPS